MNTEKSNIENSKLNLFLVQHKHKYFLLVLFAYPFIWGYAQALFRVYYNYWIVQVVIFFGGLSLWHFLMKFVVFHFRLKPFIYGIIQIGFVFFAFSLSFSSYQLNPHISNNVVQVDSLAHIWENRGKGAVFNIDTTLQYNKKDEGLFIYKPKNTTSYYYVFPVITKNKKLVGNIWVGIESDTLLQKPENVFKNQSFREAYYLDEDHFRKATTLSKYKNKRKEVMILTPDLSQKEIKSRWFDVWYEFMMYCVWVGVLLGLNFVINLFTNPK